MCESTITVCEKTASEEDALDSELSLWHLLVSARLIGSVEEADNLLTFSLRSGGELNVGSIDSGGPSSDLVERTSSSATSSASITCSGDNRVSIAPCIGGDSPQGLQPKGTGACMQNCNSKSVSGEESFSTNDGASRSVELRIGDSLSCGASGSASVHGSQPGSASSPDTGGTNLISAPAWGELPPRSYRSGKIACRQSFNSGATGSVGSRGTDNGPNRANGAEAGVESGVRIVAPRMSDEFYALPGLEGSLQSGKHARTQSLVGYASGRKGITASSGGSVEIATGRRSKAAPGREGSGKDIQIRPPQGIEDERGVRSETIRSNSFAGADRSDDCNFALGSCKCGSQCSTRKGEGAVTCTGCSLPRALEHSGKVARKRRCNSGASGRGSILNSGDSEDSLAARVRGGSPQASWQSSNDVPRQKCKSGPGVRPSSSGNVSDSRTIRAHSLCDAPLDCEKNVIHTAKRRNRSGAVGRWSSGGVVSDSKEITMACPSDYVSHCSERDGERPECQRPCV